MYDDRRDLIFVGREGTAWRLLGGNQGDMVSVRDYPVDRVLGCRWPAETTA